MATKKPAKTIVDYGPMIAEALALISEGSSVRKACEMVGIKLTTFLDNVDGEQYTRARDSQADTHFAEMADLEAKCLDGELDPQALRAAIDSRKWRLARMRPKVYGDKLDVGLSGSVETVVVIREAAWLPPGEGNGN